MSDVFEAKAKKINPEQVEVLGPDGRHIAGHEGGSQHQANPFAGAASFGGMKVMKVGPVGGLLGLLALPIILPLLILGFFILMILSMFFGRAIIASVTKTGMKVMKR